MCGLLQGFTPITFNWIDNVMASWKNTPVIKDGFEDAFEEEFKKQSFFHIYENDVFQNSVPLKYGLAIKICAISTDTNK